MAQSQPTHVGDQNVLHPAGLPAEVDSDDDGVVTSEGADRGMASASPVVYLTLPQALHSFDLIHSPRFDNAIDGIDTLTVGARAAMSITAGAKRTSSPAKR